jgi:hypothetical protein
MSVVPVVPARQYFRISRRYSVGSVKRHMHVTRHFPASDHATSSLPDVELPHSLTFAPCKRYYIPRGLVLLFGLLKNENPRERLEGTDTLAGNTTLRSTEINESGHMVP